MRRWRSLAVVALLALVGCGQAETGGSRLPAGTAADAATGRPDSSATDADPAGTVPSVARTMLPSAPATSEAGGVPAPEASAPAETGERPGAENTPEAGTSTTGGAAVRLELAGKLALVRGNDVWLYRPSTGELRRMLENSTDMSWSPDGKSIAFTRDDGLYVADGEGAAERLVHSGAKVNTPVWSPDGARIAFEVGTNADAAAEREVWVVESASGEARRVALGADPAWAPDSKRIAYVTVPAPDAEPVRRTQLRLVSFRAENDWPVIKDLPPDLPTIGVPGSEPERQGLEHMLEAPVWDKEGRHVFVGAFVLYQALSDFFVWERADAVNGGSSFVSEVPGSRAIGSPDRRAVIFMASSARGDTWLAPRAIEGPDEAWSWAETPRGATDLAPAWAPDGQGVAFYHCLMDDPNQCSLDMVSPDGAATLIPNVFDGAGPNLERPLTLSWGRDG